MTEVLVYTTTYCPYCVRAKALLDRKQIHYTEIDVTDDAALRQKMEVESGRRTVPQIFIDGRSIGGCDDLYALDKQGELDKLLKG